jgi:hypothetical protein
VEAALEKAPASDIVQISDEAIQLQTTDALFGISAPSNSSTDNLFSALASAGPSTASSAAYQGNLQTTTPSSLYDVFA